MNKNVKKSPVPCRKALIRNTVQKLPKLQRTTKKLENAEIPAVVVDKEKTPKTTPIVTRKNANKSPEKTRKCAKNEPEKNKKTVKGSPKKTGKSIVVDLNSPKKNTVLKLAKKVESVEKTKIDKVPNASELPITEQMTKVMNFPADRAIYRDLIPIKKISVLKTLSQRSTSPPLPPPREPLPLKDREPSLSEFYVPLEENQLSFKSRTKPDAYQKPIDYFIDNLKLYKILESYQ